MENADVVEIKFSRTLLDQMLDKWSPPVQWQAFRYPNGDYELCFRTIQLDEVIEW